MTWQDADPPAHVPLTPRAVLRILRRAVPPLKVRTAVVPPSPRARTASSSCGFSEHVE